MRAQLVRRRELVEQVEARGLPVSDELKEQVSTSFRYFLLLSPQSSTRAPRANMSCLLLQANQDPRTTGSSGKGEGVGRKDKRKFGRGQLRNSY